MGKITLDQEFFDYLNHFEQNLVCHKNLWRPDFVSRKDCRLSHQQFGQLLGTSFLSDFNCVIDYFGLLKKSSTFLRQAHIDIDKKNIPTHLLYFQSITMEVLSTINSELLLYFPRFKKTIISIRNFA